MISKIYKRVNPIARLNTARSIAMSIPFADAVVADAESIYGLVDPKARFGKIRALALKAPVAGKIIKKAEMKNFERGFKALLTGYYVLLKFSALRYGAFSKRLAEKDFTLLIKDKDNKVARNFIFKDGRVTSSSRPGPDFDFSLVWSSVPLGLKVMVEMGMGNVEAMQKAAIKGDLKLAGDASVVGWYLETNNRLIKLYMP